MNLSSHTIIVNSSARDALRKIDQLGLIGAVLFVTDANNKVLGSLTDGDIRRGLIRNLLIDDPVEEFMNKDFSFLVQDHYNKTDIKKLQEKKIQYVPIVDRELKLLNVINVNNLNSIVPIHAVLMAGGKGERLRPLTANVPKPMLLVGNKPIIEHNIDHLIKYGVKYFTISVCYLKEKIIEFLGDGSKKGVSIEYIEESEPMGTIGSIRLVKEFKHDDILVMNSDILTNLDFGDFYDNYIEKCADMVVASTPYQVNVPFAVMELAEENKVTGFCEKPKYTYYSNAGIYLFKRNIIKLIPDKTFYNATDLLQLTLDMELKIISEPILGYWLDIGRIDDYQKAQEDIKHLKM